MAKKEQKQKEAQDYLLTFIKPDTKLIIAIKSVSSSGMCRRMRVMANERDITYYIADLCDLSLNDKGLKIQGCGMDMTFWLADMITYCLWRRDKSKKFLGNGGTCLDWVVL